MLYVIVPVSGVYMCVRDPMFELTGQTKPCQTYFKTYKQKIPHTPNLSTDADSSTDIFVSAGVKKGLIAIIIMTHISLFWEIYAHLFKCIH